MPLDNLDTPLRLTWDICPAGRPGLGSEELIQIGERLIDAGLFYLQLEEAPLAHPGLEGLLQRLTQGGCRVSLVLGESPAEWEGLADLKESYPLLVDAGRWLGVPDGLERLEAALGHLADAGHDPALLWAPKAGELATLYPLWELCVRRKLPRFKLPNHKIGVTPEPAGGPAPLGLCDLVELRERLQKRPLQRAETTLEVHDLFLWELLFPDGGGERSEYGGCQAANSLGHIASNGDLWPCSSWPQPLGNLLRADLLQLWDQDARYRVRDEIAAVPPDCCGCDDYAICFGGCRGLARSLRADGERRDLLCPGPRTR